MSASVDRGKVLPATHASPTAVRWSEVIASALLALTGIATSWSSYQASLWNGTQAERTSTADALRVTSTREYTKAGQLRLVDLASFEAWVNAYALRNVELQAFYHARFRPEFLPAFDAWLAARPLQGGNAPPTPFAMPQYRLAAEELASRLERQANASTSAAHQASSISDQYVRLAVLFATVMFFAGIGQQFRVIRIRFVLLALAFALLVYGAIVTLSYPRA